MNTNQLRKVTSRVKRKKSPAIKSNGISINEIQNELQFICREMDVVIKLMPQSDDKRKFERVDAMLRFIIYPRYGVRPNYIKDVIIDELPIDFRIYSIMMSLCKFIWFVSQEDLRFANYLKGVARGLGKEMDKLLSEDINILTNSSRGVPLQLKQNFIN